MVGKKVETTGITIKASSTRVEAGKSIQLQVIFSPSNATGEEIVWSVYRGNLYGSCDGRGLFTGIESGYSDRAGNHRRMEIHSADNAH